VKAPKTAVVTGAGSGLGREIVKVLTESGFNVVGLGRNITALQETKGLLTHDKAFEFHAIDISKSEDVKSTFTKILSSHNSVDVLINNAAIYTKTSFLEESPELFTEALTANVVGVSNCSKAVLPAMLQEDSGIIINVGSWAHKRPIEHSASYSTSKGALHALTKAMAKDVAEKSQNLRVIEWIPGHMNTQMSDYTGMEPAICAAWCAEIIQTPVASVHSIFEGNQIWSEPLSLKQKIKKKLMGA